ncbi:MAG: PKD-like domain-containing protein, partial [Flavobacteriaceae bacterium]
MKPLIHQFFKLNKLLNISIVVGLLLLFSTTVTANNSLLGPSLNFVLQVSFTSSPVDDDDDGQINICEGSSVIFTDTSTDVPAGATYSWSFPGGDITFADTAGPHEITFDQGGVYTVILDIDGTTSELIINVEDRPNVEPIIVPDEWGVSNFGGNTYFTYCSDATATDPNFEANFAFQTASTNTTSNSVHTLTDGNGIPIYSFTGENFNLPNQFIDHYVNTGFAQVVYQIEEGSCTYQSTFDLYIGASPTATISNEGVPVLCTPGDVVYNITPGQQNGPGTIYTIQVSDGSNPVVFNHPPPETYTHTYNNVSCGQTDVIFNNIPYPNAFEISITASNACGQSTNGFAPIYIESGPEAQFEFNPDPPNNIICQNETITALDTTIAGSNITNDGNCNDFYRRFWQIIAPDGSILTSASNGTLDPNVYANVIGHMGYVPGGIDINAESASNWSSNAATSIDITFLQPGNYELTLFTGSSGQSNRCGITSYTQDICVTPEVVADFGLSTYSVCGPATITTVNNSSLTGCDNQNIYEWTVNYENLENCPIVQTPNWDFVNGTDASSFEPEFQFNTPGVYEISLTVSLDTNTDGTSCEPDTIVKIITIKEKPQTTLPTLELCESESYTFNLEVFNCYADQDATFLWDFQGTSGLTINDESILNPTVTFANAGSYPYTLTLTNECGNNQLSGTIEVYPEVLISVSGPDVICVNLDIDLNGTISGGASTGVWSSSIVGGSFLTSTNSLNTIYTPPADFVGSIVFTLTSEDPFGPCPAVSDVVEVNVQPEATVDAGTYDPFCVNTPIQLAGIIGGAASSATWSADVSGTFSNQDDLNTTFVPSANFVGYITFTLTTDDPVGPCESVVDNIQVEVLPNGQVNPISNVEYCNSVSTQSISFDSTQSGTIFNWTNSNTQIGLAENGIGDNISFNPVNNGPTPILATITVTPSIQSGNTICNGPTEEFTIQVNPTPVIPNQTTAICSEETFLINPTNAPPNTIVPSGTTYVWTVADNANVTGEASESSPQTAISQQLINTTNTVQTVIYTVIPTSGADGLCEGDPFTVTVD